MLYSRTWETLYICRVVKYVFWCFLVRGVRKGTLPSCLRHQLRLYKHPCWRVCRNFETSKSDKSSATSSRTDLPKGFPSFQGWIPWLQRLFGFSKSLFFARTTMMFTSFNAECDSSSRCSASPSGDNLYYPSPAGSYSSMGSPQSQVRLVQYCYCKMKF